MSDVLKKVMVKYLADTKDLDKGIVQMEKKTKTAMQNIAKVAGVATTAFVGTGVAILRAAQKVADLTNELTDASEKTGIAVDTLAGLRLAAEGSGQTLGHLEVGFLRFNMMVGQADYGLKRATRAFKEMDIDIYKSNKQVKNTNELFKEVRVRLSEMADGAQRNTKIMELFGRSAGPALLQSGAIDNLNEMVEATRTLGVDTTPQAIASAAEFQRRMADLGMISNGVLQDIINALTGGPSGVSGAIDVATRFFIAFGEVGNSVLTAISSGFQTMLLLAWSAGRFLTGDFKGAKALFDEAERGVRAYNRMDDILTRVDKKFHALDVLQQKRSEAGNKEVKADIKRFQLRKKIDDKEEKAAKAAQKKLDLEKEIAGFRDKAHGVLLEDQDKLVKSYNEEIKRAKEIAAIKLGINTSEVQALREKMFLANDQAEIDKVLAKDKSNALRAIHELDRALEFETHELNLDLEEERKTLEKERRDEQIAGVESILSNTKSATDGIREVLESTGTMSQEQSATLFKLQQGLAISEIAMNTAVGVSNAWAQFGAFPPVAVAATAAILAAGAAQSAVVMTQQPPKFDTGGMIGNSDPLQPDQRLIRAQTGEAVLDRATVNRLGGEKGVRNLQGGGAQVVILNPWKHLDRWNASARRMGTTLGSMTPATGQRGY